MCTSIRHHTDTHNPRRHLFPLPHNNFIHRTSALPEPHFSIAAVEASVNKVRGRIEKRAFTFRNKRRMNLLVGLMRHHELRVDHHGGGHHLRG